MSAALTGLRYDSRNIFGIEIVFDVEAVDVIVNNIRHVANCPHWACVSCSKQLFQEVTSNSILTSMVVPPESVIVDIGCHIGTYSLPLAKQGHSLISIDGSPDSIACLGEAQRRNNLRNIIAINKVLSNDERSCFFNSKSSAYSAIDDNFSTNIPQTTSTLDILLKSQLSYINQCDLIKMDVEGQEQKVIEGAFYTIVQFKPILILEINTSCLHKQNQKPNILFRVLTELGYDILLPEFDLNTMQVNLLQIDPDAIFPYGIENVLCCHKERKFKGKEYTPPKSNLELYSTLQRQYKSNSNLDSPFNSYFKSLIDEDTVANT